MFLSFSFPPPLSTNDDDDVVLPLTQVDYNVTYHSSKVLQSDDWDVLILHYVGLDHIGHLEGPMSPLIGPKLREMDSVVKNIHTVLEAKVRYGVLSFSSFLSL